MPPSSLYELFQRLSARDELSAEEVQESKDWLRELETKLFGEGLSSETIRSIKDIVRDSMPLLSHVNEDDVALACLKHLKYFNDAVQADILGWEAPAARRKAATQVERLGVIAQEMADSLESLEPVAWPYMRGRLSMSEPGESSLAHILGDRLRTYRILFGIEYPGMPGPEVNLVRLSNDLCVLAERAALASEKLRPREKGRPGPRLRFHEQAFAQGIWEVWMNVCGAAPVPDNRGQAKWAFLNLIRCLGKLVDPEFNGAGAAKSVYHAHRGRDAAEKAEKS